MTSELFGVRFVCALHRCFKGYERTRQTLAHPYLALGGRIIDLFFGHFQIMQQVAATTAIANCAVVVVETHIKLKALHKKIRRCYYGSIIRTPFYTSFYTLNPTIHKIVKIAKNCLHILSTYLQLLKAYLLLLDTCTCQENLVPDILINAHLLAEKRRQFAQDIEYVLQFIGLRPPHCPHP